MDREIVLSILKNHKTEIRKLGVRSLGIFGSTARNEITAQSDVDILVEFEHPATFDGYMETKFYLEEILGKPVDLVTRQAIKPRLKPNIEREIIYVT